MSGPGETNGVNYSVKELLAKIEGKLDGVIITIGQKADKHDVNRLREDVDTLLADRDSRNAVRTDRRWLLGLAFTLLTLAVGAVGVLSAIVFHG